ncbi:MAG: aldo/keto reductase [Dehalococcoidales bacterium]|nr:aldo/keto reductase [Dehalococcoidales bacterium]
MLGLGCRNIVKGNNEEEAVDIVRYAIDNGVNYIDAGYSLAEGEQEKLLIILGKALRDGYKKKIKLAITVPSSLIQSDIDFEEILEKQLTYLQIDNIDFCVLGGLNRSTWPRLMKKGITDKAEKVMSDGKFDSFGFFFHDYFQTLKEIIDEYDNWTLCGFQYSYMDVDHHPGYGGLKHASDKGLAVYTTEPHLGGRLVSRPPESVSEVWGSKYSEKERIDWDLKWVWNHGEISTVISNMDSIEQIKENIELADNAEADVLNVHDKVFISEIRDTYRKLKQIDCTSCRACMPCAQGIDAPRIFEIHNDAAMYDDWETAKMLYKVEGHQILRCTQCGTCAVRCGREIAIPDVLEGIRPKLEQR